VVTTTADTRKTQGLSPASELALEISYFTDPLCCWSWGFEPQLRRLRYGFAGRIAWRLRMTGMIGNWQTFSDPLNDVHRPAQLGPIWIECSTITGMPAQPTIWVHDPPSSSWPSCLAVRAAGLQSPAAADLYFRLAREVAFAQGRNIASKEVLIDVARQLASKRSDDFDAGRFEEDLSGPRARAALERDVREARFRGVSRLPCLGLRRPGAAPVWLVGWRPWDALLREVRKFAPDLGPERRTSDATAYTTYWGGATEREIAVALGAPEGEEEAQSETTGVLSSGSDL
jgi:putative protein-disulfide isomerase